MKTYEGVSIRESGPSKDQWIPLNQRERISILHIVAICSSMLAFQIAYSVEFALGTPIMKSIGIKQSITAIIWLVGPLAGFTVQPIVGFYSDSTHAKLGRRRPFIIAGTVGIFIGFGILFGIMIMDEKGSKGLKIPLFIFGLLLTNVAINFVQGPSRALLGDVIPQTQQVLANTIGSLMLGIAAVVTNLIGGIDLGKYIHSSVIDTQKLIMMIGSALCLIGAIVTCVVTHEEPFTDDEPRRNPFSEICAAFKEIPRPVLRISIVYLLSWMAYMPFQIEVTDFFGSDIFKGDDVEQDDKYKDGVNFGMLVIAVSNVLVIFYSLVQGRVLECLGMKMAYCLSQIIEMICLLLVFFVKNKYALLVIFAPLGISCQIFNSIPFAVVGLAVPQQQMGMFMWLLNSWAVIGQQIANFALGSGVAAWSGNWKAPIIGGGCVCAAAAAVACFFITVPKSGKGELHEPIMAEEHGDI
jgi:solute carrier family 45 protein 1/2/4